MALMIFSFIASLIAACLIWLVLGSRFPRNMDLPRFSVPQNILIYTLLLFVPMFVLVFTLY